MTVTATATFHSYKPGAAMAAEALAGIVFSTAGDLVVTHVADATGARSALSEGLHYTIGGSPATGAGTITALATWLVDDLFEIERVSPRTQQTDLPAFEAASPPTIEAALDRLSKVDQEQDRAIALAQSDATAALDLHGQLVGLPGYYPTIAAALADGTLAAGQRFSSDESGVLAIYERTGAAPFFASVGELPTAEQIAAIGHMTVGTFADIGTSNPGAFINAIQTLGFTAIGDGGAALYVDDALSNEALAIAHPLACIETANGRFFRLHSEGSEIALRQVGGASRAGLLASVAYAGFLRVPLRLAGDIALDAALTMNLAAPCIFRIDAGTVITYTGAAHLEKLIYFEMGGHDLIFEGPPRSLTIDGQNKCNQAIEARQQSAGATPQADFSAVYPQNCRMVAAGGDAAGIAFYGRAHVRAVGFGAKHIGRAAGTGVPGARGTAGFVTASTGGLYPKSIIVDDWYFDDIATDDAAGSANRVDVDGMVLFVENPGDKVRLGSGEAVNVMGRDIKVQGIGADVVHTGVHRSVRSVRPITNGCPIVDFQTESGFIGTVNVFLSGAVVGLEPLAAVDIAPRTGAEPYPRHLGNVSVVDATTAGDGIFALYSVAPLAAAVAGGQKYVSTFGHGKTTGRPAQHLISAGNTGALDHTIVGESFDGELSLALIATGGDAPTGLKMQARNLRNKAASVPAVRRFDGGAMSITWGQHYDLGGNLGIYQHDGNHAAASTGSSLGPAILDPTRGQYFTSDSRAAVRAQWPAAQSVAGGATITLGKMGYSGGGGNVRVKIHDATAYYYADFYVSGNTITLLFESNSFFDTGGALAAAPTTPANNFILWRDSGTNEYKLTNTWGLAWNVEVVVL